MTDTPKPNEEALRAVAERLSADGVCTVRVTGYGPDNGSKVIWKNPPKPEVE